MVSRVAPLGVGGVVAGIGLVALLHSGLGIDTKLAWATSILVVLSVITVKADLDARRLGRPRLATIVESYFWTIVFAIPTSLALLFVVSMAAFCVCLSDPDCAK